MTPLIIRFEFTILLTSRFRKQKETKRNKKRNEQKKNKKTTTTQTKQKTHTHKTRNCRSYVSPPLMSEDSLTSLPNSRTSNQGCKLSGVEFFSGVFFFFLLKQQYQQKT